MANPNAITWASVLQGANPHFYGPVGAVAGPSKFDLKFGPSPRDANSVLSDANRGNAAASQFRNSSSFDKGQHLLDLAMGLGLGVPGAGSATPALNTLGRPPYNLVADQVRTGPLPQGPSLTDHADFNDLEDHVHGMPGEKAQQLISTLLRAEDHNGRHVPIISALWDALQARPDAVPLGFTNTKAAPPDPSERLDPNFYAREEWNPVTKNFDKSPGSVTDVTQFRTMMDKLGSLTGLAKDRLYSGGSLDAIAKGMAGSQPADANLPNWVREAKAAAGIAPDNVMAPLEAQQHEALVRQDPAFLSAPPALQARMLAGQVGASELAGHFHADQASRPAPPPFSELWPNDPFGNGPGGLKAPSQAGPADFLASQGSEPNTLEPGRQIVPGVPQAISDPAAGAIGPSFLEFLPSAKRSQLISFLKGGMSGLSPQEAQDLTTEYGPSAANIYGAHQAANPVNPVIEQLQKPRLAPLSQAILGGESLEGTPLTAKQRLDNFFFSREGVPQPEMNRRDPREISGGPAISSPETREFNTYAQHPWFESYSGMSDRGPNGEKLAKAEFNQEIPTTEARHAMGLTDPFWSSKARQSYGQEKLIPPGQEVSTDMYVDPFLRDTYLQQGPTGKPTPSGASVPDIGQSAEGSDKRFLASWQPVGAQALKPGQPVPEGSRSIVTTKDGGSPMTHIPKPHLMSDGSQITDARFVKPDYDWNKVVDLNQPLPPEKLQQLLETGLPEVNAQGQARRLAAVKTALNRQGITVQDRNNALAAIKSGTLPTDISSRAMLEVLNAIHGQGKGPAVFRSLGYSAGSGTHNFPSGNQRPTGNRYIRVFPASK